MKEYYKVSLSCKARKMATKLPRHVRGKFEDLIEDLREKGPVQKDWMNFAVFYRGNYHCHLDRRWAVCWRWEKGTPDIEIYYAGSREGTPCDGRG